MTEAKLNQALHDRLAKAASDLDINVSRETLMSLQIYIEQLLKWNKTYNLTALRTENEVVINHIFDCMSILNALQKKMGSNSFSLVDVGSGAGLPGIIVGIFFPNSSVVCIDTVEKKATFMRHVIGVIGCRNVQSLHARVEEVAPLNADVVISRAFSSLSLFTSLAGQHCGINGLMVSMKSAQVQEDLAELTSSGSAWGLESLQELQVPEMKALRYLVWLQREKQHD